MRAIILTKMEKMIILLAIVAIFNILGPLVLGYNFLYFPFSELYWASVIFWGILSIINEILVVSVLILMIKMGVIMLTKTEKKIVILLVVVAIFNIYWLLQFGGYVISWVILWIINEILVVSVLILMIRIRKE